MKKLEKFYFQIQEDGKNWEDIKAAEVEFKSRKEAVEFARKLVKVNQKEIRMTDNPKLLGGTYFSIKFEIH